MPLFDYNCRDCKYEKEYFLYPDKPTDKICPECGSKNFKKKFGTFKMDVGSSDPKDFERKINKGVKEIYSQIGRESLDNDTKTLSNMFGSNKVESTYNGQDD